MFDISLPVSELPVTGYKQNDEYFNEHRAQWEQEVLAKLQELGYPAELWPSDSPSAINFVRQWKGTGLPLARAPVNLPLDKTPYDGPVVAKPAMEAFNKAFPFVEKATFYITRGEEWWPHDKAFLCRDAETLLLSMLYEVALRDQSILDKPTEKKLGRPRNEAAHAAKAEKTTRYQKWLAECSVYRDEVAEVENAYLQAKSVADNLRTELNRVKARGAPKWIP